MILFTETVYRKAFTGSAADYSDMSTWHLLGSATQMLLQVNTYSETDFTLTVVLEGSWDGIAWNEVDSDTVSVSKDTKTTSFLSMKQATATGTWAPLQRLKLSPSISATLFMEAIATGRHHARGASQHAFRADGDKDSCGCPSMDNCNCPRSLLPSDGRDAESTNGWRPSLRQRRNGVLLDLRPRDMNALPSANPPPDWIERILGLGAWTGCGNDQQSRTTYVTLSDDQYECLLRAMSIANEVFEDLEFEIDTCGEFNERVTQVVEEKIDEWWREFIRVMNTAPASATGVPPCVNAQNAPWVRGAVFSSIARVEASCLLAPDTEFEERVPQDVWLPGGHAPSRIVPSVECGGRRLPPRLPEPGLTPLEDSLYRRLRRRLRA